MNKSVIAYIDILGYEDLVDFHSDNIDVIKKIEKVLANRLNWADEFQKLANGSPIRKANQIRLARQSYRIVSDTIMVCMPLANNPLYTPEATQNENELWYLKMFLWDISSLYSFFMAKLGFTFRGGIAIDEHYENIMNKSANLFIFSKALIKAYKCEKQAKELNCPGILIGHSFIDEVCDRCDAKDESCLFFDDATFKDEYGNILLNIYYWIDKDDESAFGVCRDVADVIHYHLLNHSEGRTLDKYLWLARHHNYQMHKCFGFCDLIINLRDQEKKRT